MLDQTEQHRDKKFNRSKFVLISIALFLSIIAMYFFLFYK